MSRSVLQNYPQITQIAQMVEETRARGTIPGPGVIGPLFAFDSGTRFVLFVKLGMTASEWYVVSVDEHVLNLSPYFKWIAISNNEICDFAGLDRANAISNSKDLSGIDCHRF